jgi:hypothetical protein
MELNLLLSLIGLGSSTACVIVSIVLLRKNRIKLPKVTSQRLSNLHAFLNDHGGEAEPPERSLADVAKEMLKKESATS